MRNKLGHKAGNPGCGLDTKTLTLPWKKKRHANSQAKTSMVWAPKQVTEQLWTRIAKIAIEIYGRGLKINLFLVQYLYFLIHHMYHTCINQSNLSVSLGILARLESSTSVCRYQSVLLLPCGITDDDDDDDDHDDDV